ncbi:DEAD/DEAH box helicase [Rhodococcus sp. BP-252]|uniref:DEAD/DEAH box helicase n=1 Tax=unclassified Rhodococcus (in: high G+C Gram-positive bacteria) TaxID=192944 RepID=UPI001C9B5294|nr:MULTISPECIES: DEAD/DEAH box helicase [unclassified Rhodococcus (in: high G+C Gram-positive bacteria)]MBY6414102.1 DEAD/DEAH box helicase [Rhodococcus sp. BP-320]MBY6418923.1 DEAD/DEAH box helicase [Rhodococcus sp. BP-321]MBY6423620.1 DEAD/DEAH box helicase [Rhodococcus sp. BP-324]MBY6428957.1 DEAD/DEAH box helicase [Rhodococcus sp. BP-323]MBY6433962.1 DEAD/DEAH box helicase [Rhodococcus sp. BP-322]
MSETPSDKPVELFDALFADADTALGFPAVLRSRIKGEVDAILDAQADAVLRASAVSDLKQVLPKGTRLGGLEKSRLRTVLDLAISSPGEIAAVPGIGPQSARTIYDAATAHRKRVRAGERLRLNPQQKSTRQTQLVKLLTALDRVQKEVGTLQTEIDAVKQLVEPWREPASRSTSWIKRVFTSKASKLETQRAIYQLNAIAKTEPVEALRAHVSGVFTAGASQGNSWDEYERDAAALNALLSQFTTVAAENVDATHGFIGEKLTGEAQRVALDRTHMRSYLRAYQAFGAQYILHRRKVVLGDEMGLGKTIQALAVSAHLAAQGDKHVLVICPASVLINWGNETRKHTTLRVHELHGPFRDSAATEWARSGGVAVTTFNTLSRLNITVSPQFVIVDEAHYIKNHAAQRSIASRRWIDSASRAVLLTGTPMENRVNEFRGLVEYVQPDTARRIHVHDGLGGATSFRKAVAPAYLRRNQVDVLKELPDLIEVEDWVQPHSDDTARYRAAVGSGNFMAMRQAAYPTAGGKSAKLDRLREIVEEAEENDAKVIVFSYFRSVLDTVCREVPGAVFGPLTGGTPTIQRQKMVDDFTAHRGRAVLVSQIEAGGVGLNIQAASVVILTEPQWKPSTEVQAIARTHRMGQVRTVQVHRLLAKDTVDDRMREVLAQKSALFDEYARKSQAKEKNRASVDDGWDRGVGPAENSIVDMEKRRLGLA